MLSRPQVVHRSTSLFEHQRSVNHISEPCLVRCDGLVHLLLVQSGTDVDASTKFGQSHLRSNPQTPADLLQSDSLINQNGFFSNSGCNAEVDCNSILSITSGHHVLFMMVRSVSVLHLVDDDGVSKSHAQVYFQAWRWKAMNYTFTFASCCRFPYLRCIPTYRILSVSPFRSLCDVESAWRCSSSYVPQAS